MDDRGGWLMHKGRQTYSCLGGWVHGRLTGRTGTRQSSRYIQKRGHPWKDGGMRLFLAPSLEEAPRDHSRPPRTSRRLKA